jgi:hypothetical protein
LTSSETAIGALSAFLRGVERRGVVFAELQSGDAGRGDAALAATLHAFARLAPRSPFAEWPRRFWAMLLASPDLRGAREPALRDGPLAVLAGIGAGPRAALLLRLVAGLTDDEAAAVLGIARSTYRTALLHAFPRTAQGEADAELWQAMGEAAQQLVRDLPQARLDRIAASRGDVPDPARATERKRTRWLWPGLLLVALLTAVALAATWWWPAARPADAATGPRIRTEALPEQGGGPAGYGKEAELLTHRDLDLLLDAVSGDGVPADPAFDAWLVAALDGTGPDADAPRR